MITEQPSRLNIAMASCAMCLARSMSRQLLVPASVMHHAESPLACIWEWNREADLESDWLDDGAEVRSVWKRKVYRAVVDFERVSRCQIRPFLRCFSEWGPASTIEIERQAIANGYLDMFEREGRVVFIYDRI